MAPARIPVFLAQKTITENGGGAEISTGSLIVVGLYDWHWGCYARVGVYMLRGCPFISVMHALLTHPGSGYDSLHSWLLSFHFSSKIPGER